MKYVKYLLCTFILISVALWAFYSQKLYLQGIINRWPEGDVGNGCTAVIVWLPLSKTMTMQFTCGAEIDVQRINNEFVYVKTCTR